MLATSRRKRNANVNENENLSEKLEWTQCQNAQDKSFYSYEYIFIYLLLRSRCSRDGHAAMVFVWICVLNETNKYAKNIWQQLTANQWRHTLLCSATSEPIRAIRPNGLFQIEMMHDSSDLYTLYSAQYLRAKQCCSIENTSRSFSSKGSDYKETHFCTCFLVTWIFHPSRCLMITSAPIIEMLFCRTDRNCTSLPAIESRSKRRSEKLYGKKIRSEYAINIKVGWMWSRDDNDIMVENDQLKW